jgi:tetratricopeptide (TPR) repeat protein
LTFFSAAVIFFRENKVLLMNCPKCNFENPDDSSFCSKCGAQLTPSEKAGSSKEETLLTPILVLTIGSTFAGRYQIIEELGIGGMGKVYKVFDKEMGERVVLKLLKPEIAADEKVIERFRNEVKLARKITHKNVCRMYDFNKEKDIPYITMEYISGEDLKSTIKRVGALNAAKAIFIAKQICEGLAEAHRLVVIHRDLKPQNIMIDKQGNSHIMDFGIARSPLTDGLTTSGMMVGSPYYVSPEQVQAKEVDQRSDIYSLGVILYEMVTGGPPFTGEIPIAVAYKHTTEKPKNPREVNEQVPEELGRVILKCLEKDKAKRYQSVQELYQELENIEKGILPPEKLRFFRRLGILWEFLKKPKLRRFLLPASSVIGLIAVVAIAWFFTPLHNIFKAAPPPPAVGAKPAEQPSQLTEDKTLRNDVPAMLDQGIALFNKKSYGECLKLMESVLKIDPNNAQAKEYYDSANIKISTGQIQSLVNQYVKALNTNKLLAFYESNCSPKFYQSIKGQAKRVSELYDNIQSKASNSDIKLRGSNQAVASFRHAITGVSKKDKIKSTLFEGIHRWTLEKQGASWKIIDIDSQSKAKK